MEKQINNSSIHGEYHTDLSKKAPSQWRQRAAPAPAAPAPAVLREPRGRHRGVRIRGSRRWKKQQEGQVARRATKHHVRNNYVCKGNYVQLRSF